jgi:tRNA-Thr(GGU) m(6)t(6)A37 methyltransferase TsaA
MARDIPGTVEIDPKYEDGLSDLDGFSHIVLLYHFHLSSGYSLKVKPYLDDTLRGVFATRAPHRPNQIGMSVVRLKRIDGTTIHILDVDIVDGTPLLDIKPYVTEFDPQDELRIGWLKNRVGKHR